MVLFWYNKYIMSYNFNWPLTGNRQITQFLEKIIKKRVASGTFIFNGSDDIGKGTVATYFAKSLLCNNFKTGSGDLPCGKCASCRRFQVKSNNSIESMQMEMGETHGDFHVIRKQDDKKNISIEQIRGLIKDLSLSSFLGLYKIGIIKQAETLSEEAANALLKTLEEPKKNVVIVLLTNNIDFLPQTIVSRSQVLNFSSVSKDLIFDQLLNNHKATRSEANNFSHLSLGRPALAIKFLKDKDFLNEYNEKINLFLNFVGQNINERLMAVDEMPDLKITGAEAVKKTESVIDAWQGVLRDWMLIEFGHVNMIQNKIEEMRVRDLKNRLPIKKILDLNASLEKGREYLRCNVNPKLVLENIVINI